MNHTIWFIFYFWGSTFIFRHIFSQPSRKIVWVIVTQKTWAAFKAAIVPTLNRWSNAHVMSSASMAVPVQLYWDWTRGIKFTQPIPSLSIPTEISWVLLSSMTEIQKWMDRALSSSTINSLSLAGKSSLIKSAQLKTVASTSMASCRRWSTDFVLSRFFNVARE